MTRRIVSWMVALMLAAALFAAPALAATYGYVTSSGYVRLRSGPGDYPTVASVKAGSRVEMLGMKGNWYRVRLVGNNPYVGYIYKDYVRKAAAAQSTAAKPVLGYTGATCTVRVASTALRKGVAASAGSIATLRKGAELAIAGSSGKYYKARDIHTGKKGYVLKTAVKAGASATMKGKAYMRTGGSTSARVLRTLPKGARLVVYKVNASWSKVRYGGKEGYVHNAYLRL
ncbi:MAG: SH3 domain-containing protein [Clostridiales bacterium]|nr:SH3 domain-containing protein [Clostridiales bacterium]